MLLCQQESSRGTKNDLSGVSYKNLYAMHFDYFHNILQPMWIMCLLYIYNMNAPLFMQKQTKDCIITSEHMLSPSLTHLMPVVEIGWVSSIIDWVGMFYWALHMYSMASASQYAPSQHKLRLWRCAKTVLAQPNPVGVSTSGAWHEGMTENIVIYIL